MTINPTINVQIILITRFHFLIDFPRMLLSSKMTRIVLVVIRTKLKSPICHKSPPWAVKIKPSNNPIFTITLKHNSTMVDTFAYPKISPQQDTFVSIVMQKSCQCQFWILSAKLEIIKRSKIQKILKIFCLFSLRQGGNVFAQEARVDRRVQRILIIIKRYRKENICKIFIFLCLRITLSNCLTL